MCFRISLQSRLAQPRVTYSFTCCTHNARGSLNCADGGREADKIGPSIRLAMQTRSYVRQAMQAGNAAAYNDWVSFCCADGGPEAD